MADGSTPHGHEYSSLCTVFSRGMCAPVSYTHLDVYKRQFKNMSEAYPKIRYRTEKNIKFAIFACFTFSVVTNI